jgi:hypothetical protein
MFPPPNRPNGVPTPLSQDANRSVSETLRSLEYRMMDEVQEPINPDYTYCLF